ncbi:MAG: hypothetical protein AAFR38_00390 [Planctomycetota bacterium]
MVRRAAMVVAAVAGGAPAQAVRVPELIVPYDAVMTIEFVSRSAGFIGELSLVSPEPITLLRNDSARGTRLEVGAFQEGDELVLSYRVVRGRRNVFLSDRDGDTNFWFTPIEASGGGVGGFRIGVEDLRGRRSDFDFNDAVYEISFDPVATGPLPSPGAGLAVGAAGLFAVRRRRS